MCLAPQELRTVVADTTDSGVSYWSTGRRVILERQEDENRRERQETVNLNSIVQNNVGGDEDKEDDEGDGDERDIWEVEHVTEEDFQSTEGETEDLYDKLMEMVGWKVKEFVERVRRFL